MMAQCQPPSSLALATDFLAPKSPRLCVELCDGDISHPGRKMKAKDDSLWRVYVALRNQSLRRVGF